MPLGAQTEYIGHNESGGWGIASTSPRNAANLYPVFRGWGEARIGYRRPSWNWQADGDAFLSQHPRCTALASETATEAQESCCPTDAQSKTKGKLWLLRTGHQTSSQRISETREERTGWGRQVPFTPESVMIHWSTKTTRSDFSRHWR